MKDISIQSDWGTLEVRVGRSVELKLLLNIKGPRGGNYTATWLSPLDALALSGYLKAWALEVLKFEGPS